MKPQNLHAHEDRLLDFAYGELPSTEARAVESHLEGCTRCSELLADIRGVRTTMAQLPMEPAPDAGLESLLAYAQQAARNAAAGPAPKPTWWRRWLVPVVGVAAVCTFGIISIQVSKSVDLRPELSAKSESVRRDAPAYEDLQAKAPREPSTPAAPEPVAQVAPSSPVANAAPEQMEKPGASAAGAVAQGPSTRDASGMTPPAAYPAAKLDDALMAKEAPRKKAFVSGTKAPSPDWGNAGAGPGFERAKTANEELASAEKKAADKVAKDEEYSQRDAMTQVGTLLKSKTIAMGSTRGDSSPREPLPEPATTPAPAAAQPAEEEMSAGADGVLAEGAVQQQVPSRGSSLRLNGGRTSGAHSAKKSAADAPADDFDELFSSKQAVAKREQQESRAAAPSPPPPAAAAAPRPSMPAMNSAAPSLSTARAEQKGQSAGPSPSELSKLAEEAFRSGNRVREAQLLTPGAGGWGHWQRAAGPAQPPL